MQMVFGILRRRKLCLTQNYEDLSNYTHNNLKLWLAVSFFAGMSDLVEAPTPKRERGFLIVMSYALGLVCVLGLVELQPRAGTEVAVLVSPWSSPARAATLAAQANGDVVGGTRWPFIIVARPRDARFVANAYARGAWLVFDAGLIAGCRPHERTA